LKCSRSVATKAIRLEANFPRTIHLLLSDIMMPDMSGPDLACVLKQKPFLPTVLLGRVTDILRTEVRDQGTDHFDLRK